MATFNLSQLKCRMLVDHAALCRLLLADGGTVRIRLPNGGLGKTALPRIAASSLWLLEKAFGQALYDVIVGLFDSVDHAKEFHILG